MKRCAWFSGSRVLPGRALVVGGMCLLAATRQVMAEDASADVKAAFARLADAPNVTFQWRTEIVPAMPQGVGDISGKMERDGWTLLTQVSPNGTYDIAFKKRKGLVKMPNGWKTVADLIQEANDQEKKSDRPRPMRRELSMLTSRKLPIDMAGDMVRAITTFKKEGDFYTSELTPEEVKRALGLDKKKGVVTPAKVLVRIRIEQGFLALMEMQQRFEEGGVTRGFNITAKFSDIGKTIVEIPSEAKRRMQQVPALAAIAASPPASAGLSREEALVVAKKVQEQLAQMNTGLFIYAIGNEGRYPEGKTSNEAFRVLFQSGVCEDEMLFAIPDARARSTRKLPDGQVGTVDDGFANALAPGECDVTFVTPLPHGSPESRNRPVLRADIKASDGTILTIFALAHGKPHVIETRDGIIFGEPPNDKVDIFSAAAGVEPGHLLRPAAAGP